MNNTALLTVIAVILLGIFAIMIMQMNEETPVEQLGNDLTKVVEGVQNAADDNT